MKARINAQGVLEVWPENETEAYALLMWNMNFGQEQSTYPSAIGIRFCDTSLYKDTENAAL